MRRTLGAFTAAALLLGACSGKATPSTVALYTRVPVPAVPNRTAPPADVAKDGQYWATSVAVTKEGLDFSLAQAFFGATCTTELGADKCPNDFGVDESKKGGISLPASALSVVTVVAANGQNYAIDGTELARLVQGSTPSAAAPSDFHYVPGPFLVTIQGGSVVSANEIGSSG